MSRALARARTRFEATPRKLDDEALDRIARGDRGCLGDVLSGFGAVLLVTTMILGAMDIVPFSLAYVGVALWVGGFASGPTARPARATNARPRSRPGRW